MDKAVADLATKLCSCNSEALKQLKSVLWKNTDNWDELLIERAKLSGKLILSEEAQTTLQKYAS
jgi:methylglutaconyl-CoA hydratase